MRQWGVWDDDLSPEAAQRRYARFAGLDLGVAPEEHKASLRRDLLEFEDFLACHQHDVGYVGEFPLVLTPKPGRKGVH